MTARALLITSVIATIAFSNTMSASPAEEPTAYILCYHIVESPQDDRMEVSRDVFRQHMRYLAMTGYNVIPLRHLYEYVTGKRASIPKNAVVVTVDDGWRSTYTEIFPEMQRRNFPFTVFVYPKIIGQTAYALSWKQVREMSDAGVDIQSHSLSHPFLAQKRATLNERDYASWLNQELSESKRILEKETGRKVQFLAYPYGDYNERVTAASARAGYSAAVTCEFGKVRRGSDPLRMKRIVIDKRMDFTEFRQYLGAAPLKIAEKTPVADVVEPAQPLVISARIPNPADIDPKTVGMALLTPGRATPFSYDAKSGSIQMVVRDTISSLQGKWLRALIWATDLKTGKRVEATWTFRIPEPEPPPEPITDPAAAAAGAAVAGAPIAAPAAGAPTQGSASGGSPATSPASGIGTGPQIVAARHAPK